MTTGAPVPSTDLADRYGRRAGRPRRWGALVVVAALVSASLAWLAWTAWVASTPDVRSTLLAFDVRGAHRATARVQVWLDSPRTRAVCRLQAYAADHTPVGELAFLAPQGRQVRVVSRSLRTERRATTVELDGCTTADQPRPR